MRKLLYISPCFPPQAVVGAMRPLKFVQHLGAHDWEPVVLSDLWAHQPIANGLVERVPAELEVVRDYSRGARRAEARWRAGELPAPAKPAKAAKQRSLLARLPAALSNPELVPLGEHALSLPHAMRAAARLAEQHEFEAILVNADPYAALIVGAWLAQRTGLPLVCDLRDPWGPCELRRPMRPAPMRAAVDRMERYVFERAARVLCNTDATRADYLARYPERAPGFFVTLHNHGDPALLEPGADPAHDRFTLLFLGRFRRFVHGNGPLELLAALAARGHAPEDVQLLVTGDIPGATSLAAERLGVAAYLRQGAYVPYPRVGAAMAAADLLLLENVDTEQRLPAKLFDYLLSERPIVALQPNHELRAILARTGAGEGFGPHEIDRAADFVERYLRGGRQPVAERRDDGYFTSAAATARLAAILDEAAAGASGDAA
ncbi:glycosyltransferase [Haliangium ochraceum]|uniref:glycosyltransferase n=1 Tax=Haliangium ochraceum TaxID=80816 RepID=UPI0003031F92|nr:glycosyltransferase [Haliangium ochraceum]